MKITAKINYSVDNIKIISDEELEEMQSNDEDTYGYFSSLDKAKEWAADMLFEHISNAVNGESWEFDPDIEVEE
jgi:uncharacterized membrane-anchored protein